MLKKGFTLIELLVVIAIIAVLAGVGIANFLTAQRQARDSSRAKIMLETQSSLEQYFGEFSAYPVDPNIQDTFEDGTLPVDPRNSGDYVINWSYLTADEYCICAKLETQEGNAGVPSSTSCDWSAATKGYFCVQNKQ